MALSLGSPRVGVTNHRALPSSDFPPVPRAADPSPRDGTFACTTRLWRTDSPPERVTRAIAFAHSTVLTSYPTCRPRRSSCARAPGRRGPGRPRSRQKCGMAEAHQTNLGIRRSTAGAVWLRTADRSECRPRDSTGSAPGSFQTVRRRFVRTLTYEVFLSCDTSQRRPGKFGIGGTRDGEGRKGCVGLADSAGATGFSSSWT